MNEPTTLTSIDLVEYLSLVTERDALREALRSVEWLGSAEYCPSCGAIKDTRPEHWEDCKIAAALKRANGGS